MTQTEFENRTGIQVSASEFDQIHEIYMNCGDMDKDMFCKEYKKVMGNPIVNALSFNVSHAQSKVDTLIRKEKNMAMFLADQAEKWGATDLRDEAIRMMGAEKYLAYKIEHGFNLWQLDRDLLVGILTNN
jgi:hypothetical protein